MKYLLYYFLIVGLILMQAGANAQKLSSIISGKIVESGTLIPVPGATISLHYSKVNTTSNNVGVFSFVLENSRDTMYISHIGYKPEKIPVESSSTTTLIINLERLTKELDNIIVNTGFQYIPKERVTGSFGFVDATVLNQQSGTNILDRLNGIASGVLFDYSKVTTPPNKNLNLSVRGLSTINGIQDPLIVLDNFPYDGDISNINPNMIESITILKDAAASSIWGTRAGNGVIVITTKRGQFNQPTKIEFNSSTSIIQKPDLFSLPQMASGDYIDLEEMLFDKGYFKKIINNRYGALTPVADILFRRDKGLLTQTEADDQISVLRTHDIRNEYNKYFYRNAINQQCAFNLYGGSHNISYIVAAGLDKNISNLDAGYTRMNVRAENTYKPFKNLQLIAGAFYTTSKSTSGRPAYNSILSAGRSVPYLKFKDNNGNPVSVPQNYRDEYTDTAGSGKLLNWKFYPTEDYNHSSTNTILSEIVANIGAKYQVIPGLIAEIAYKYQRQESNKRNLQDTASYSTRNLINMFSQINPSTGFVNYIVPLGGILNLSDSYIESKNARVQLNYNKTWSKHSISAILGSESREIKTSGNQNTAYGFNNDLLTTSTTDFLNSYPNYVTGYESYVQNGISFSETLNRFISFYGNGAYTYQEKYTLSASARKDASNLFGVNANDKWKPFWSIGGAWEISKEDFYSFPGLSYLKLRASWGASGNVDQTKSAVTVLQYLGAHWLSNLNFAMVTQYANPNLSWEQVNIGNVGIDFATSSQRFSGSLEYFLKKSTGLFGPSPLDYTAGLANNYVTRNVADMKANGIDLILHTINFNKAIKWKTDFLISYYSDKTINYNLPKGFIFRPGYASSISPIVGKPLYSIFSYNMAGLNPENGNPQGYLKKQISEDYNSIINSFTDADSLIYHGPATPKVYGSIGNTFFWKGFSLNINLTYKLGYYFRKRSIGYTTLFSSGNGNADFAKRWKNPGDEAFTNVPSMVYPGVASRDNFYLLSQHTVLRADNIRLQFINLSYDFFNLLPSQTVFKSLQLYLNAANLGIIWRANKDGLDPEYPSSLSASKAFAIGLRTNF